jgi:hypothetical protein
MPTWEITRQPVIGGTGPAIERVTADRVHIEGPVMTWWQYARGNDAPRLVLALSLYQIREVREVTDSDPRVRDAWDPALCAVPPCSPDSQWQCATHATAGETMQTWTFFGHWENDRIVVETYVKGEVDDPRVDTGAHEQGLWAASGTGTTVDEARTSALGEYDQHG